MIEQQQTYFLDLYRAGIRTATDVAKATLESAQRLQTQQAEVLRQAIDDNTRSARQLSEANSLADVMAVQVKLAGAQAERTADFWTRAWRTASETQVAMLGQVQNQVGQLSERVRESVSLAARAGENAASSGADALRDAERKTSQQAQRKTA
ncbi:MAG TPA: phasin family protein [Burkholderiales bacterium]|nr:phasin family protein [Burkholderiales bacterium]